DVEISAAEFAVGDGLQAYLLLHADHFADRAVFDGTQPGRVDLFAGELFARIEQIPGPQEAADMIGARRNQRIHKHSWINNLETIPDTWPTRSREWPHGSLVTCHRHTPLELQCLSRVSEQRSAEERPLRCYPRRALLIRYRGDTSDDEQRSAQSARAVTHEQPADHRVHHNGVPQCARWFRPAGAQFRDLGNHEGFRDRTVRWPRRGADRGPVGHGGGLVRARWRG